jgi:Kef-type K+ transport system membrane component KefB
MKRLIVVIALLAMMVALERLGTEGSGATDPLTLAAIGFVILAAFAVAELLGKVGLPKVTGYLLCGIGLGPYVGDVLTHAVVDQMGMFQTLAIGLIALMAGLGLEARALAKLARTMVATTAAKLMFAAPLVAATLIGVELLWHPLGITHTPLVLAIGLVFGALSLGTSPAIALAVISETKAKGRLSELVLGSAVFKDLLVIVALAVSVTVANTMSGAGSSGSVLGLQIARELGGSLLAGVLIGALLIAYMRFIQTETLLFVAAMVLVGAELAELLRLELLLIFIVAGFTVRNLSEYQRELLPPLEMVSLPVFVVLFTTVGAAIDIHAALGVLPLALLLVLVRAFGYWASAKFGNWVGDEAPAVADTAWYSYLPQAGITLGLVALASSEVRVLSDEVFTLGLTCVALNLLIGPPLLHIGLTRAGELPSETGEVGASLRGPEPTGEASTLAVEPLSPELAARLVQLRTQVGAELERGVDKQLGAWISLRRRAFAHLDADSIPNITMLAESPPRSDATMLANELAALFEQAANYAQRLEVTRRVPLEPHWLVPDPNAGWLRRSRRVRRRLAAALGSRRAKARDLPLRLIAREAFEPRIATGMLELFRASCRCEAQLADALRLRLQGSLASEHVGARITAILDAFEAETRANVASMLDAGSRRMHLLLARIDSPAMAIRELDFAEAAQGIERELEALLAEAEQWPQVIDACWQTVEVSARIRRLDDRITSRRDGAADLGDARTAVDEELGAFARRLRALRDAIEDKNTLTDDELDALEIRARALLPKPAIKRLRQSEQRLRRSSDSKLIQQALREAAARDTGAKPLIGPELVVIAPIPAYVRGRELDVRELIDGEIAGRLLPATERDLEVVARVVADAQQAAATMVGDVELLTEVYRRHEDKDKDKSATLDDLRVGLERVQVRCEQLHRETVEALAGAAQSVAAEFEGLGDRLATALHEATGAGEASRWVSRRTDLARRQVWREFSRLREQLERGWTIVRERVATLAGAVTSDYRLRSGLTLPSAAVIAKLLENEATLRIGPDYATLFSNQPIRDPRFFVANREILRSVARAERNWQTRRSANAVLIVGGPGSGKTSVLNVASLKLATRDVTWLDDERAGFIAPLASELHCPDEFDAVLRRLLDRPRVVVIDDLERRLPLGHQAIDELEQLAQLIAQSSASCFWVVTASRELQLLLARSWPLRVGFAELIELGQLDGDSLGQVILARHRISHLELAFPLSPLRRAIARTLKRDARGQQGDFFVALARMARGNLRAALTEWCRAATITGETLVLDRSVRTRTLPFVRQLPTTALAMLATIVRFGPVEPAVLAHELQRDASELERWTHFLLTAGLLVSDARGCLGCPPSIRDVLARELGELAVLHQEVD